MLRFLATTIIYIFWLRSDQQHALLRDFKTVKEHASLIGKTTLGKSGKPSR